jgi:hypothetical protein
MVMEIRIQRHCKAIAKLFPCLYEPQGINIDIRMCWGELRKRAGWKVRVVAGTGHMSIDFIAQER